MHSLWSAAVPYTNYGTGGAFELPTQNGTYLNKRHSLNEGQGALMHMPYAAGCLVMNVNICFA